VAKLTGQPVGQWTVKIDHQTMEQCAREAVGHGPHQVGCEVLGQSGMRGCQATGQCGGGRDCDAWGLGQ
jgi:hypothetical protein